MDHLSSEELSAYLSNTMNTVERENVERHLVSCTECRAELIEGQRAIAHIPDRKRVSRRWYGIAGLAAAAAILVAVWPHGEATLTPAAERNNTSGSGGSVTIVSPAPDARLDASTRSFTWRRDDGSSYKITVTDETGRSVWSQITTDTTIALPNTVQLARDGRYFWYVDALRPDGRSVTSGINSFNAAQ